MIKNSFSFEAAEKAWKFCLKNRITEYTTFTYVDFSIPSNKKRLFFIDGNQLMFDTYCAHGSGSGRGTIAKKFSNTPDSHMSSLGVYKTLDVYTSKKFGLARQVQGLEPTNNKANSRAIVIHKSNYVGAYKSGNSWGCFAVPNEDIDVVLELTEKGTILVAYYPDNNWLTTSKYLNW